MNIKDKILEVSNLLDELDAFEEEIPNVTQYYDYKMSDLYHLLENSKLNSKFCYRFCKELQLILKERRKYKNNMEIYYELKKNKDKFCSEKNNRKIALSKICSTSNRLEKSKYHNRIYTEEELEKIVK